MVKKRNKSLKSNKKSLKKKIHSKRIFQVPQKKNINPLKKENNPFNNFIDLLPQTFFEADDKGQLIFVNQQAYTTFGYNKNDFYKGLNVFQMIVPEDHERAKQNILKLYQGQSLSGTEYTGLKKDGSKFPVLIYSAVVLKNKKPAGIRGIIVNIAEQKRIEQALHYTDYQYRLLLDSMKDIIHVIDTRYNIIFINQAFKQFVPELNMKEVIGKNLFELFPFLLEQVNVKKEYEEVFHTGKNLRTEETLKIFNRVSITETLKIPIFQNNKVKEIVTIIHDITELKKEEDEKVQIKTQLLQMQKMESVGRLAGGIAHDLNNILLVIQGNIELFKMDIDTTSPFYEYLTAIQEAYVRASNLIHQLLLFSRKHPMEFGPLDLNKTIENLLNMLKRIIREDIKIESFLQSNLLPIKADKVNIEQVLMNLILNAQDAMPKGGTIKIKTDNVMVDAQFCKTVPYAYPGEFVYLEIADKGKGMDPVLVEHIFEPFFTTKEEKKGSGLGLAVVYGIVKQHKGWINVVSELGKGSQFMIYLPIFDLDNQTEELQKVEGISKDTPLNNFNGTNQRILVIEDEDQVCQFLKKVLEKHGYTVFEAPNAQKALDIFNKEEGNFDLIFSDVVLPDMNGPQLVTELLAKKPDIPVLMSSGYFDKKYEIATIKDKGYKFIEKPYSLTKLLQTVYEIIKK